MISKNRHLRLAALAFCAAAAGCVVEMQDAPPSFPGGYGGWTPPGYSDNRYPGPRPGPDAARPGPDAVCFYEHRDFTGASFCAREGQQSLVLDSYWNDRISSIRVPPGLKVGVCEHKDFDGWCEEYTRDAREMAGLRNDAISSYRVMSSWDGGRPGYGGPRPGGGRPNPDPRPGGGAQACFFEHINYSGDSFCVPLGDQTGELPPRWNDRISSIRIIGEGRLKVCEDKNFGGRCTDIDRDVSALSGNDTITSYHFY